MNQALVDDPTLLQEYQTPSLSLFDILHNTLILSNVAPYLPVASLLHLAATNQSFRDLILHTPGVFRHLDLTQVKSAQFEIDQIDHGGEVWRNVQLDENLTEDDFYSGPLRGIFGTLRRRDILRDVQTLILDGLSVTSELCYELINDEAYSIRLLSLREAKNLNPYKLRGALQYACRPSRPDHSPRLKALYVFGPKDAFPAVTAQHQHPATEVGSRHGASVASGWNHKSQRALTSSLQRDGDAWWSKRGRVLTKPIASDWINCLVSCEGSIAFDAVLCKGPRHRNSHVFGKTPVRADSGPAIATIAVSGCTGCGKAPEGLIQPSSASPVSLPLLAPPPILSSSVRAATTPNQPWSPFVPRCGDCLGERYCTGCQRWWCESCYQFPGQDASGSVGQVVVVSEGGSQIAMDGLPIETSAVIKSKPRVSKSCWECGSNCDACIHRTQRVCKKCCGGYCIIHNEGSSSVYCDWCVSRGRGLGRL